MSDELNPCGHCGGKAIITRETYRPEAESHVADNGEDYIYSPRPLHDAGFVVECKDCGARGPHEYLEPVQSIDLAVTAWNTRPIEDALRAENAKLHEQIADLYATIRQDGEERGTVIFERNLLQLEVNKLKARVEALEKAIEDGDLSSWTKANEKYGVLK